MIEIYSTKQIIDHANNRFNKYYNLAVLAINTRLQDNFITPSDFIDISDIHEFYNMDEKDVLWRKIVADFKDKNWDIFPLRVNQYTTIHGIITNSSWKIAVRDFKK